MDDRDLKKDEEFYEIEEKLVQEAVEKDKKEDMLVEGKSVFDIQKIKNQKLKKKKNK